MQASSGLKLVHVAVGLCSGCLRQVEAALSSGGELHEKSILVVSGAPSHIHAREIQEAWRSLPEPKVAIAVGACACSGGVFRECYAFRALNSIIPVKVMVSGCPPPEEAILKALREEAASADVDGYRGAPAINEELCVACGLCSRECPPGALEAGEGEKPRLNQWRCISCSRCEMICPRGAIEMTPRFTISLT